MLETEQDNIAILAAVIAGCVLLVVGLTVFMPTAADTSAEDQNQERTNQTASTSTPATSTSTQAQSPTNNQVDTATTSEVCTDRLLSKNLKSGSRGPAVRDLQRFLNTDPDTRLTASGLGSPGNETADYGPKTARAVERFQAKHLGSGSTASGFWDLQSRMQARLLCANNQLEIQPVSKDNADADKPAAMPDEASESATSAPAEDSAVNQATTDTASTDTETTNDPSKDEGADPENQRRELADYTEPQQRIRGEDTALDKQITKRDKLFGGEAILSDFHLGDSGWTREGETDTVADINFDTEASDVLVSRVDVSFVHTGDDGDDEPWEVFKEIGLEHSGERVASVDADQQDNWIDHSSDYDGTLSGDEKFTTRLHQFERVIQRGNTANLDVVVETQESVDDAGDTAWGMLVADDGVRVVDAVGVQKRIGNPEQTAEFAIYEGRDRRDRLAVGNSYKNPASSYITVFANTPADPLGIFAFNVNARGSTISLDRITLQIELKGVAADGNSPVNYSDVINQSAIAIGDTVIDVDDVDTTRQSENKTTAELTFEIDEDITLDGYGDQTVKLITRFHGTADNYEPKVSIRGSVGAGGVETKGEEENDDGIPGSWHILRGQ